MSARNGAIRDSVSEVEGGRIVASKRDGNSSQPHSQQAQGEARTAIHAELAKDHYATACGIVARSPSPVLKLCRMLVDAGHDPGLPLEAWRNGVHCLRIRSIGEAASLEVNANGTGFRRAREADAAPPIDLNAPDHAEVAAGDDGFVDWPPSDDGGAAR